MSALVDQAPSGELDESETRQSVTDTSPTAATDFDIKIVVIGDKGVGKTTFISQYYHNMATPPQGMRTVNRKVVDIVNRKQRCTVAVTTYDDTHIDQAVSSTSSTSHSRSVNQEYCKALYSDAHGVFIFFDVTDRESFVNLQHHLLQMAEWGHDDAMVFFLANHADVDSGDKCDSADEDKLAAASDASANCNSNSRFGGEVNSLPSEKKKREVTTAEAELFADTYGGFMLDTSALTGAGVTTAYEAILYAVTTMIADPGTKGSDAADILSSESSKNAGLGEGGSGDSHGSYRSTKAELFMEKPTALKARLGKKSKYLHSWNERYFTLDDGILYFQRVDGHGFPANTLFMTKDTSFTKVGDMQIEVVAPLARKDMLLKFPSTEMRDEWILSLRKHGEYGTYKKQKEHYDQVI